MFITIDAGKPAIVVKIVSGGDLMNSQVAACINWRKRLRIR